MFAAFALGTISLAAPTIFAIPALVTETAISQDSSYDTALKAYNAGDYATALIHAKMSGSGGNTQAQVLAGHILMRGGDGFSNPADAAKWFLKAAALGQTDAMLSLSELAVNSQAGLSAADAIKWLKLAADKGRTDAMLALSEMHTKGKGTPPNAEQGKVWLIKAANYGDAKAMRKLGDLSLNTAPIKALNWYEKAANLGDDNAAYAAAIMYAESFEIKPDSIKAAQWLAQAAKGGIAPAQADYGLMVYQGNGVAKSSEKAAAWFKRAALGGDPEGRFLYAFTLAKGDGVPKSFEDAYYWLLRAESDSGKTGIDEYDQSRVELKTRLENNVDPTILQRARTRAASETNPHAE